MRRSPLTLTAVYLTLLVVAVLFIIPFVWLAASSLKTESGIYAHPYAVIPQPVSVSGYSQLFSRFPVWEWLRNSLVVGVLTTVLSITVDSLAGYALARIRFRGRGIVTALVLLTFLMPGTVAIVPLYLGISDMGFLNTYAALVLPVAASPFGVFLFMQFFRRLPRELEDAARIDGAGWWKTFRLVMFPLAKAAAAALGLLTFIGSWNNYFWPLVAESSNATTTIPVGISTLISPTGGGTQFTLLMASAVVATLPTVIVFLMFQRYFMRGISWIGVR